MLINKHILLILLSILLSHVSYAQQQQGNGSTDYENAKKIHDTLAQIDDNNINKALNASDSLLKAGETNGNYHISCLGYSLKGRIYYRMGKYDNAIDVSNKWKELASKNNDNKEYFDAYYFCCDYEKYVNSAKALVMGQKMISEANKHKYMPGLALSHEALGNLALYILQDYSTSTYHLKSAIDIKKTLHVDKGEDIDRLYYKLASSLGEEHKFDESQKILNQLKSIHGNNLPPKLEFRILIIQLDNAYNAKVDASTFNQIYQKVVQHPMFTIMYGSDTRLFYKIRWLIRTNHGKEALANIPRLSLPLDRAMLKADAYASLSDWHNASIMKDSIELTKDSMMHEMRNEEFSVLDAEMKNSELSIESAENKARYQYVLFGSIFLVFITILSIVAYFIYRRRKRKLEREREYFVRNVTHQLRTPMTVVTGMVEQLKEHIPANDTIGLENLEATKRQSRKLQELIMQLARMEKTGVTPVNNERVDLTKAPVLEERPREINQTPTLNVESNKSSILLAEDTDDVAMMMSRLLQDNGFVVTRAVDGQEALDILQNELPDILVTDVAMPRMDGLELMRSIRKDDSMCHLPIIVISARVEDSERMEGISAGAEAYLTKPFIPEELVLRINTMLKQRELIRRSFSHMSFEVKGNNDANDDQIVITPQMSEEEKIFMDTINKYIDGNISSEEKMNVKIIASNLYTSVSTINRKVKNITGMPIATYIRTRRIIYAKRLLTTTNKSISEIEILCGLPTPGHLTRIFKMEVGMSPSEYRQTN